MDAANGEEILTTLSAAKLADVSPETIRAWANTGRLETVRTVSGQRIFTREAVLAAMAIRREWRRRVG